MRRIGDSSGKRELSILRRSLGISAIGLPLLAALMYVRWGTDGFVHFGKLPLWEVALLEIVSGAAGALLWRWWRRRGQNAESSLPQSTTRHPMLGLGFRVILRLYPGSFSAEFGVEIQAHVRDEKRHCPSRRLGRFTWMVGLALDLVKGVPTAWLEELVPEWLRKFFGA